MVYAKSNWFNSQIWLLLLIFGSNGPQASPSTTPDTLSSRIWVYAWYNSMVSQLFFSCDISILDLRKEGIRDDCYILMPITYLILIISLNKEILMLALMKILKHLARTMIKLNLGQDMLTKFKIKKCQYDMWNFNFHNAIWYC